MDRLQCVRCGGELVNAELEFIEDDRFYINMDCKDCGEANGIKAEPIDIVSGDDYEEINLPR